MLRLPRLIRMISSPVLQTPKRQTAQLKNQFPVEQKKRLIRVETLNEHVNAAKYAVRGELLLRAEQLRLQLETSPGTLPFSNIIYCNIGNPQQLGQPPITFFRQVLSLLEYPALLKSQVDLSSVFPPDVLSRAKHLLSRMTHVGPYTNTQGLDVVREEVANFITRRDGFASSPENIFLTDGASPAVQSGLKLIIRGPQDGIMIPIPQYPLYSATITMLNGSMVTYYLDEEKSNWGLQIEELERSYEEAVKKGVTPRALCIINPGNPTGQCLLYDNQKEIIRFCIRKNLALFADEVYQENSYLPTHPFNSFKKVAMELGKEAADLELLSFHSISKGFTGECGHRGGYVELHNIDPDVKAVLYKLASISLCPNVVGQILIGLMTNPPVEGDPSYELYLSEKTAILQSLHRRAEKLVKALNQLEGIHCRPVEGAMYVFPKITLSKKACEAAKLEGKLPDVFYTMKLLEATGICVVPGSGFGQREGTWHFRTTFLPLENQIDQVIEKITLFHQSFSDLYRD